MGKYKRTLDDRYNYLQITIINDGYGNDYSIDEILDDAIGEKWPKEDKIRYLNAIIHDIEHYRDSLL